MSKRWEAMEPYLKVDKQLKILDIGCNTGCFSFLAQTLGHNVTGIDIDEECITVVDGIINHEKINLKNIKFEHLKEDLLDYLKKQPTDYYDFVFYLSVHHHVFEQFGIKVAPLILKEISRIGKNMFFDMGQSDEVDNGYLTWKKHIPEMQDSEKSIIANTLLFSNFVYGEVITSTKIHEADRLLFIFNKEKPDSLSIKELIINGKKYFVDKYIWKDKGSSGDIHASSTEFPTFGYNINSRSRFYMACDCDDKKYFIKERFYTPLQDYLYYNKMEYERGQKIKHIPKTLPAIDIDGKYLVFDFYTLHHIGSMYELAEDVPTELKNGIFKTVEDIVKVLGGFDYNLNNILCRDGDFRIIDFEPAEIGFMSWKERMKRFKEVLT